MKKNIIVILLLIVLCLTGCGKKKNEELDIELEKGNFTTVCKVIQDYTDASAEVVTTTNFGADMYVMNYKIKTVYHFESEEQYEFNANETKNNAPQFQNGTDTEYKYSLDDKNKSITTVFAYKKMNYGTELKDNYKAKAYIENSENSGATCEIIGATRSDIGL